MIMGSLVSTHSRPKAAATRISTRGTLRRGFNTQPPEGGCRRGPPVSRAGAGFNTQPPEGGCDQRAEQAHAALMVSTHSRPKAAAAVERNPPGAT